MRIMKVVIEYPNESKELTFEMVEHEIYIRFLFENEKMFEIVNSYSDLTKRRNIKSLLPTIEDDFQKVVSVKLYYNDVLFDTITPVKGINYRLGSSNAEYAFVENLRFTL